MTYSFIEPDLTLEQANRLLAVLWGTNDDYRIHEENLDAFTRDRVELYSKLGKPVAIRLSVEFVQ
jgi:hypothetical protein